MDLLKTFTHLIQIDRFCNFELFRTLGKVQSVDAEHDKNFLRIPMALSEAQSWLQRGQSDIFATYATFRKGMLAYLRLSSYHLHLFHTSYRNQRRHYLLDLRTSLRGGIHQLPIRNEDKARANQIVRQSYNDNPSAMGNVRTSLECLQADIMKEFTDKDDIDPHVFLRWAEPQINGFKRMYHVQVRRLKKIKHKREGALRAIHTDILEMYEWDDLWTFGPAQTVAWNTLIPVFVDYASIHDSGCYEIQDMVPTAGEGSDSTF
ncbi:MAG: hypothetical protein Q9160_005736 [Pyrenula sp. 1 TL-2023]